MLKSQIKFSDDEYDFEQKAINKKRNEHVSRANFLSHSIDGN